MDRWASLVLVGVLAGASTAVVARLVAPTAPTLESTADPQVDARLARIEAALAALAQRGPWLDGRGAAPAGEAAGPAPAAGTPPEGALSESFRSALRAELGKALESHATALREAGELAAKAGTPSAPAKRRAGLAEAARELQMSADEEEMLRGIYAGTHEKMLRLLAKDDTEIESIRTEMEEATRDPKRRPAVIMKYMPRMLPRLGEVIGVQMEQKAAVESVLGSDRAARLERDFDLVEANPLGGGIEGDVRVERR
ncbi:MAG: hypothetical protein ACKOCB_07220 [Planctomycetia bacterium]